MPKRYFLELRFKALMPIGGLPHFHGPQWAGLLKNILNGSLQGESTAEAGVTVHPVETGILAYGSGDAIHVGLSFPEEYAPAVFGCLRNFESHSVPDGHFMPGKTLALDSISCRVSGAAWDPTDDGQAAAQPLSQSVLQAEVEALAELDRFSLCFYTPLRLTRPAGKKSGGHRYADEHFFFSSHMAADSVTHLLKGMRLDENYDGMPSGLRIAGGALMWLDVTYGRGVLKTIGGVVGRLEIEGRPRPEAAARLIAGQYLGAGKNAAFGFGFFRIPQVEPFRVIRPLTRGISVLGRAVCAEALGSALKNLPDSSPGPDGLTLEDLRKAGPGYLARISGDTLEGRHTPAEARIYRIPKKQGAFREIAAQNVVDRMLARAVADYLQPSVDMLLSKSSYAYRRGFSAKGAAKALRNALASGWDTGVKADISSFFGSIDLGRLMSLMEGLYGNDPLVPTLESWLRVTLRQGIPGLAQGSPLSPVLSNLYLDRFDRDMEREGFRLIRYADDFVVLFPNGSDTEEGLRTVTQSLARLGLCLQPGKTVPVRPGEQIRFLGYMVSATEVADENDGKPGEDDAWLPMFRQQWLEGNPVYLTSVCRGAFSNGPYLVVNGEDENPEKIPWSRISRLVVVGRSSFSGGVVYRAVKEEVPVTFIDVLGKFRGQLVPSLYDPPALEPVQKECASDPAFCLSVAKLVVAAKINNSRVMLRRKNIEASDLKKLEEKAGAADDLDQLRGYEGAASRAYFAGLSSLVHPFEFKGRVYHPPDGPVNAMLSFGYTLLYNRLAAVLKDKGFNNRIGFFHQARGRHCALASDLMEEMRHVAERVVLALIRMKEVKLDDFEKMNIRGTETCRLKGEGFRKFIRRFEQTLAREISYHGGDKMSYNAYFDEMANNLKRSLMLKIPYLPMRID
jgi:CRISPR-associated endonuclease Cas1